MKASNDNHIGDVNATKVVRILGEVSADSFRRLEVPELVRVPEELVAAGRALIRLSPTEVDCPRVSSHPSPSSYPEGEAREPVRRPMHDSYSTPPQPIESTPLSPKTQA